MSSWGLSPAQHRDLILSVGSHRVSRPLTPVEVAELFEVMTKHGATLKDCADFVHLDGTSMVSRFLKLLRLSPSVQHNVDWGQSSAACFGFTTASALAALPRPDHEVACRYVLEEQLTSAQVKDVVQLRQRSGKPIEDCIEQIIKLRPTVTRRFMFVGGISEQYMAQRLAEMRQSERDELLSGLLAAAFPAATNFSCRLGTDRFSIVGGSELAEAAECLDPDFETAINSLVSERLSTNG
jgi:hypothetical protein